MTAQTYHNNPTLTRLDAKMAAAFGAFTAVNQKLLDPRRNVNPTELVAVLEQRAAALEADYIKVRDVRARVVRALDAAELYLAQLENAAATPATAQHL